MFTSSLFPLNMSTGLWKSNLQIQLNKLKGAITACLGTQSTNVALIGKVWDRDYIKSNVYELSLALPLLRDLRYICSMWEYKSI